MQIKIIFEDAHLLVIDKPAGVTVNRAVSEKNITIQDWVEQQFPNFIKESDKVFLQRSGIAHRLDKDTSGLLLIAKTSQVLHPLMAQFKDRTIKKKYIALVHGTWSVLEGGLQAPLGRVPGNRKKFGVVLGGKLTRTEYKVRKQFQTKIEQYQDGFALVDLYPQTGRTHQLRVIMQHLGYPLVSDKVYLGRKRYKKDVEWCPRHFLHAEKLSFRHPVTERIITTTASLPQDLGTALSWVEKQSYV